MSLNPIISNSIQYILSAEFVTGSFTNITDDLKRFNCVRDIATLDKPITIGQASLILDNADRQYSPANSSSPYYDLLRPNIAIKFESTYAGSTRSIFKGVIQNINISPVLGSRVANIDAVDSAINLKKADVRLDLYQGINAASLFSIVTSIAGVTETVTVDPLSETIPFVGESSNKASVIIQKILDLGHYYFNLDGSNGLRLRNRYFNLENTAVASLDEFYSFSQNRSVETVKNYVKVKSSAKILDTVVNTVAFIPYPQSVSDSSWINFYIDFINPYNVTQRTEAQSVSIPSIANETWAMATNFDGSGTIDGVGSLYTESCSLYVGLFGDSAVCSLYNGSGSDLFLTKFNFSGYSIYPVSNVFTVRESTSSQNKYGRIDLSLTNEYINNIEYTENYAVYLRDRHADPRDEIDISINSVFPECLDIELGEVVNITENESALDGTYDVFTIEHDINLDVGPEHIVSIKVEKHNEVDPFIVGDATNGTLDTATNTLLF